MKAFHWLTEERIDYVSTSVHAQLAEQPFLCENKEEGSQICCLALPLLSKVRKLLLDFKEIKKCNCLSSLDS